MTPYLAQPKEEFGRSNGKADNKRTTRSQAGDPRGSTKKGGTGERGLPSRSLTGARVRQKIERTSFKELTGSFLLAES